MADFAVNILLKAQDEASPVVRQVLGETRRAVRGVNGMQGRAGRTRLGALGATDFDSHRLAARLGGASANIHRFTDSTKRAVSAPLELAMNFEQAMTEVRAVTGDAQIGSNFDLLTDKARQLGRDTEFTAEQVAQGLKFMGIAGLGAAQQLETISPLLDAATVSGEDLGRTSDLVTDVMGGFGLKAGTTMANGVDAARFAVDSMIATTLNANTNLSQLAQGMFKVGPLAAKVGVEFNEVAALLGSLANAGIKGAEGGTALRNIMLSLSGKPSKDMRKLLKTMGLSSKELRAELGKNGIAGAMGLLMEQMQGMSPEMQLFASNVLFGRRTAVSATDVMSKLGTEYADLKTKLDDSAGASKRAAEEFRSTHKNSVTQLKSALSDLGIEIGDNLLPVLAPLIEDAKVATKEFAAWAKENPELVAQLGKAAFAMIGLGTILSPVLLAMSSMVSTITFGAQAYRLLGPAVGGATTKLADFATTAGAANPAIKTMVGSTAGKLGILGAVVGSFLAGQAFGEWADETFGLSDQMSRLNRVTEEQVALQMGLAKIRGAAMLGDLSEQDRAKLQATKEKRDSLMAALEEEQSGFSGFLGDVAGVASAPLDMVGNALGSDNVGLGNLADKRSRQLEAQIAEQDAIIDQINEKGVRARAGREGGGLPIDMIPEPVRRKFDDAKIEEAMRRLDATLEVVVTDERIKVKKRKASEGVEITTSQGINPGGL